MNLFVCKVGERWWIWNLEFYWFLWSITESWNLMCCLLRDRLLYIEIGCFRMRMSSEPYPRPFMTNRISKRTTKMSTIIGLTNNIFPENPIRFFSSNQSLLQKLDPRHKFSIVLLQKIQLFIIWINFDTCPLYLLLILACWELV